MKIKFGSLLLIGVFVLTSMTVFGSDAVKTNTIVPSAVSRQSTALWLNYNSNMEYCSVDLDNRNSNLNVRTWEGKVIGKIPNGARVWVNEYSGEWARVSVKRGRRWVSVGWVDSTYLSC
ncbi:MAG: SH3 domain-containing protein [Actinomycetota bacterium]